MRGNIGFTVMSDGLSDELCIKFTKYYEYVTMNQSQIV